MILVEARIRKTHHIQAYNTIYEFQEEYTIHYPDTRHCRCGRISSNSTAVEAIATPYFRKE
jgi:hypothetical protein